MMFAGPIESLPHVRSGRLRALAVTTPARFAAAPDLPTMAESGLALDLVQWNGLFAPAGVPPEIIAKLNAEVTRILRLPDVKERLLQAGFEPRATSSREFAAFVTAEYDRWGKVIKSAGVRLE
jgi:tripartite-type tricarboxylate transporter receptor subunit TctC